MSDYVIAGDTKDHKGCLIYVYSTPEAAEAGLHRILTNPTDTDKRAIQGHFNLRIEEVLDEYCWWHGNCD